MRIYRISVDLMNWEKEPADEYIFSTVRHVTEEDTFFSYNQDLLTDIFKRMVKEIQVMDEMHKIHKLKETHNV